MSDTERDIQCLTRLQRGDTRALAELYDRYTPLLYSVALRILRSGADAEDAVQDTWVQVFKRAATFDARRGPVAAWLLTVTRTRALDRYRSLASRRGVESRVDPDLGPPPEDPAASASSRQLGQRVRGALAALEPQQRQVLEIAYFEGLSQSEI